MSIFQPAGGRGKEKRQPLAGTSALFTRRSPDWADIIIRGGEGAEYLRFTSLAGAFA
ncbi:MAG: hypothetical protein ACK4M6_09415 [Hyphomonas sp.]